MIPLTASQASYEKCDKQLVPITVSQIRKGDIIYDPDSRVYMYASQVRRDVGETICVAYVDDDHCEWWFSYSDHDLQLMLLISLPNDTEEIRQHGLNQ